MKETYLELILSGEIVVTFFEDDDGRPMLDIEYATAELKDSIIEPDLTDYLAECIAIATMAGFEAPTEYYRMMKDYVQDSEFKKIEQEFETMMGEAINDSTRT